MNSHFFQPFYQITELYSDKSGCQNKIFLTVNLAKPEEDLSGNPLAVRSQLSSLRPQPLHCPHPVRLCPSSHLPRQSLQQTPEPGLSHRPRPSPSLQQPPRQSRQPRPGPLQLLLSRLRPLAPPLDSLPLLH
jgi:hypothetical protein